MVRISQDRYIKEQVRGAGGRNTMKFLVAVYSSDRQFVYDTDNQCVIDTRQTKINWNEVINVKFTGSDVEYLYGCKYALRDYNRNIKAVEGINVNNYNEEQNFRKSFNTGFYKFLNTTDWPGSANSAEIPYMQDYTQPWTDKRFCEYFGITGYIDDDHAVPNSEWEIILNTIK